jgi:hypothetical protein
LIQAISHDIQFPVIPEETKTENQKPKKKNTICQVSKTQTKRREAEERKVRIVMRESNLEKKKKKK